MSENTKENLINLITELNENRLKQYSMLDKVLTFRDKMDVFLPKEQDYRVRNLAQEKIKAANDIIKTELDIRKSIDSSIIKEIELRSKYENNEESTEDALGKINIRDLLKSYENQIDLI